MNASRDASFDDYLVKTMKDPAEAAAYIEAVMELDDPAALLVALRQVAKAHGMAEVVSVISKSDGLLVTLRDGRCAKDLQQNGTGIATGAVFALGG